FADAGIVALAPALPPGGSTYLSSKRPRVPSSEGTAAGELDGSFHQCAPGPKPAPPLQERAVEHRIRAFQPKPRPIDEVWDVEHPSARVVAAKRKAPRSASRRARRAAPRLRRGYQSADPSASCAAWR